MLAPKRSVLAARAALVRSVQRFRAEVARSIFRKRVPEIAFEVLVQEEMSHE